LKPPFATNRGPSLIHHPAPEAGRIDDAHPDECWAFQLHVFDGTARVDGVQTSAGPGCIVTDHASDDYNALESADLTACIPVLVDEALEPTEPIVARRSGIQISIDGLDGTEPRLDLSGRWPERRFLWKRSMHPSGAQADRFGVIADAPILPWPRQHRPSPLQLHHFQAKRRTLHATLHLDEVVPLNPSSGHNPTLALPLFSKLNVQSLLFAPLLVRQN
jgi:hypothetical protein